MMKRVLIPLCVFALVLSAVADDCEEVLATFPELGNVIELDATEDGYNPTVNLVYKMSLKGQSLQRTNDIDDCGGDCNCTFDVGKMEKIRDDWYLVINVTLPATVIDWWCSGAAIGALDPDYDGETLPPFYDPLTLYWNNAGIALNKVWLILPDMEDDDITPEIIAFHELPKYLNGWRLKGYMDEDDLDDAQENKTKKVDSLYALTWMTGYSQSTDGNPGVLDDEAFLFPFAQHRMADRAMGTRTISMQVLSDKGEMEELVDLVDDDNCKDMYVPVPYEFEGCMHGFVDWYNPKVNCWEHLNLDVDMRLDKKLTRCINSCTETIIPPDGCNLIFGGSTSTGGTRFSF